MSNIRASRDAAADNRTRRLYEAVNKPNFKYPRRFD
jgi:hypothetical protein